jgi:hypothetical protein
LKNTKKQEPEGGVRTEDREIERRRWKEICLNFMTIKVTYLDITLSEDVKIELEEKKKKIGE